MVHHRSRPSIDALEILEVLDEVDADALDALQASAAMHDDDQRASVVSRNQLLQRISLPLSLYGMDIRPVTCADAGWRVGPVPTLITARCCDSLRAVGGGWMDALS